MPRTSRRRRCLVGLVAAGLLATALPSFAGVGEGEPSPTLVGKEFINTPEIDLKALRGRVILYDIFRTW